MSKFAKIPLMIAGVGAGHLDMKMMTIVAPLLEKWYDSREHDFYL